MKHKYSISILIALIVVLSATAASIGIFSAAGPGPYEYESIRGETVEIYGSGFLIFNSVAIAFLWLGVVVPPLLDGSVIPVEVEHYTTLVVQGLDLGLLLPLAFLSGWLFIKKKPIGYLLAPTYLIFLSILMTALVAKIATMGLLGQNIIPVVFIIPAILVFSILCVVLTLSNIRE